MSNIFFFLLSRRRVPVFGMFLRFSYTSKESLRPRRTFFGKREGGRIPLRCGDKETRTEVFYVSSEGTMEFDVKR